MKSPELRKELSELALHKRGIRINLQLPLIESEDEIVLRSAAEVRQRLIALELLRAAPSGNDEALRFLLWAAGVQPHIGMPDGKHVAADLASAIVPDGATLAQCDIKLRTKSVLLDWADLLYRLHWAVRHAQITARTVPGRLDAQAVHAWHQAVNWLIRYEDEDNWDLVSTDTAG